MARYSYGWGIVNKLGEPWWDESCVCEDRTPLDDTVRNLNDPMEKDAAAPYRVVRLYFQSRGRRRRATDNGSSPRSES